MHSHSVCSTISAELVGVHCWSLACLSCPASSALRGVVPSVRACWQPPQEGVPTAVPLVEVPRAKRIREEEHIPQSAAMGSSGMPIDSPTELPVPTDMPSPTSFVPRDQAPKPLGPQFCMWGQT